MTVELYAVDQDDTSILVTDQVDIVSSMPSVISVNLDGSFLAVSEGDSTLIATMGELSTTLNLSVISPQIRIVTAAELMISQPPQLRTVAVQEALISQPPQLRVVDTAATTLQGAE